MFRILWTVIGLVALTLVMTPKFESGSVVGQSSQRGDKTWMSVAVEFVQKHIVGKEKIAGR